MSVNDNSIQDHQQLQSLLAQKEAAIQAKGRLIDNMAYQIRTLSNAVIGFSDLLLIEDLNDDLMEYVSEINQAVNGLSALVNEVLDWARRHNACPVGKRLVDFVYPYSTGLGVGVLAGQR